MDGELWNKIAKDYEEEDDYTNDFDEIPECVVDNILSPEFQAEMMRNLKCDDDESEISINSDRYESQSTGSECGDEPKVVASKNGLEPSINNDDKNSAQVVAPKMEVDDIKSENESTGNEPKVDASKYDLDESNNNDDKNSAQVVAPKMEVDDIKSEDESTGSEPKVDASKQGLDPSNNNDTKSTQLGTPEIEVNVDDINSYCSSNSEDSSAKNQTLFGDTLKCLNSRRTRKCKVLIANCKKQCQPSKEICGISRKTTNFQTHLRSDHVDLVADEIGKNIPSEKVRSYEEANIAVRQVQSNQNSLPSTSAASRLTTAAAPCPTASVEVLLNTQIQFNANVLNYFLTSFTSLDVVESPEFWAMFDHSDVTMPRIGEVYDPQQYLKQTLKNYKLPKHKIISIVTKNCYNFSNLFKDLNINTPSKIDIIHENESFRRHAFKKEPYICYTSTLSLIATIDIPKLMDNYHSFREKHEWILKKVFLFLFLASSNTTLAPMLADLKKPDVAKWNSIYNSIAYFLKLEQKCSFVEMTELLKMDPFTEGDIEELKQYVNSLRPLALAFDRLQSEEGSYHGYILPTLVEMRKRCEQSIENKERYRNSDRKQPMSTAQLENLIIFEPFLYTIRSKCLERFFKLLTSSPEADLVIIASMSHPFFKEKWVPALGLQKYTVRAKFIEAVKKENPEFSDDGVSVKVDDKSEHQIDDFDFGEVHPKDDCKGSHIPLVLEVLRYLGDNRRNLEMLKDYPAVKRVFLKYNTSLSSSEPVEKLFPYETRQNIANYGALKEDIFEERVFVIVNKDVLVW